MGFIHKNIYIYTQLGFEPTDSRHCTILPSPRLRWHSRCHGARRNSLRQVERIEHMEVWVAEDGSRMLWMEGRFSTK